MIEARATVSKDASRSDSLDRLLPLGRAGTFIAILGGLIFSFFVFGFWNPYWRIADQDILMIYDAFLQNSGLPREVVLHPAHLTVLALGQSFRLLHSIGLLGTYSLSTIPPTSSPAAFNQAWTDVVHVGRLISLAIVLCYVTAFGFLIHRLVRDWRISALAMFAMTYAGGIAMSARSIKPELLSSCLVAIALLVLLIAAQSPRMAARPLLVGAAALIATLALDNKVQAIFLISAMPVLLLPFGETSGSGGYWTGKRAFWALTALAATALLAGVAASPLVFEGLLNPPGHGAVHSLFGKAGMFQALLAVWIGLGMLTFTIIWRTPPAETVAAALAIIAGIGIGLLPLYIAHETQVVTIVINPVASLFMHVTAPVAECSGSGCGFPFALLFFGLKMMLAHHSFFLQTSPRPEIFLEWFVIAAIIVALRGGHKKVALQAVLLIGTAMAIDTLQAARAIKQDYFNFTDPLIVIAAALLLANVPSLRNHRWTYPIGALLIVLHVAFSQAEPIKHAYLMRSGPESDCVFLNELRRIEPFPFCRQ